MGAFLRNDPHAYVGNNQACRRFVAAVIWIDRRGAQWCLLPAEYGPWNSVYKRFARWCEQGVWERTLAHVADDTDMEHGIVDSTVVLSHPCTASAEQKRDGGCAGIRTESWWLQHEEIHILVDGVGNSLRLHLTAGQCHDSPHAPALLEGLTCEWVIADRGYAAQAFIALVLERGAEPVIPPHPRAKEPRDDDRWWYRERHLVECFINKITHVRRVFSRFGQTGSTLSRVRACDKRLDLVT